MKERTIKQTIAMLHRVIEAGLARQVDPEMQHRPVVEITPAGVNVMEGREPPADLARRPAAAPPICVGGSQRLHPQLPARRAG